VTGAPQEAPPGDLPTGREAGAESQDCAPVFRSAAALRVVFDTNVLVSLYVFADSRFAPLRARTESGEWTALTNEACFGEFRRVLGYPLFALTGERQQAALAAYEAHVTHHAAPAQHEPVALPRCKDRDDQKFLELARDGGADWLVTADKALLRLARRDRLRGLFRILTPEAALAEV
jgi:putative PIN family toxin of toxin-antitoxin system